MDITCPHCGHHLRSKPEWAGRTAICKSCNGRFVIPAAPSPNHSEVHNEVIRPSEISKPPPLPAKSDANPFDFLNQATTEANSVKRSRAVKLPRRTFTLLTILGTCILALLAGAAATVVALRSTTPTASRKHQIAEHTDSPTGTDRSRGVTKGNAPADTAQLPHDDVADNSRRLSKGKAADITELRKPNTVKAADTTTLTFTRDATRQLLFEDPNAVMFSADGARLLAVGENDAKEPTLLVWSTRSWEVEASAVLPTSAKHLAMTHDQSMVIIFSGKDEKLWLLDPQSFTIRATLTAPGNVIAFSVAPNALEAASVSAGEWQIQIWDLQNRHVKKVLPGPAELATCIAYSPDGSRLATTGIAKVVLWNTNTAAVARNFDLGGEKTAAFYVAFSPDGRFLAASCNDSKTRIWNVASGDSVNTLDDDKENVFSVEFAPDGRSVLTRSMKGFDRSDKMSIFMALATGSDVCLWNLATRTSQHLNGGVSLLEPQSFTMSPNGLVIACASNKAIRVWEAKPQP